MEGGQMGNNFGQQCFNLVFHYLNSLDVKHRRSCWDICLTWGEGSVEERFWSNDLASSSPPDMLSITSSSFAIRHVSNFAPPNFSCGRRSNLRRQKTNWNFELDMLLSVTCINHAMRAKCTFWDPSLSDFRAILRRSLEYGNIEDFKWYATEKRTWMQASLISGSTAPWKQKKRVGRISTSHNSVPLNDQTMKKKHIPQQNV